MQITKASVILNTHTADCVVLQVGDMPSPMPFVTSQPLDVMFYTAYDTGVEYVKTNFPGVPIAVTPRS